MAPYYSTKSRPPSPRAISDAELKPQIQAVFEANYSVYGAHKVWKALGRDGVVVGRDRVARHMPIMELAGATRARKVLTTRRDPAATRAPDLVLGQPAVRAAVQPQRPQTLATQPNPRAARTQQPGKEEGRKQLRP